MRIIAQKNRGFTLVELIVVVAIVVILAVVVLIIINPSEWTKKERDVSRLSDMADLQQAIDGAVHEASNSGADILCVGGLTNGVCSGKSTDKATSTTKPDGTGWVKVDLRAQKNRSVSSLPVDPINNSTHHYTYCSDGSAWEIDTVLESAQQKGKMANDGGDENAVDTTGRYEVGSKLDLITTNGTCTY